LLLANSLHKGDGFIFSEKKGEERRGERERKGEKEKVGRKRQAVSAGR
jgi:hypothetical protein